MAAVIDDSLPAREGTYRILVAALSLAVCVNLLVPLSFGPFLPYIAAELGVGVPVVGQVPGAITLGGAALGLFVGPLSDRFSSRSVLVLGLLGIAISALIASTAQSLAALIGVAIVASIGRATIMPMAWTIAAREFSTEADRRQALGWVFGGVPLAAIAGVPLLAALGQAVGWRSAFMVLAGIAAATIVVCRWVIPSARATASTSILAASSTQTWRQLIAQPVTRNLIVASLMSGAGTWSVWTYIGAFFAERHGLGLQAVSGVYFVCGVGLLFGNLLVARLLEGRAPLPTLLLVRASAATLYGVSLMAPWEASSATVALAGAMFGIGIGLVITVDMLIASSDLGRATVLAVNAAASSFGAAAGAALGGVALTFGGYESIGAVAAIISLLALIPIAAIRHPHKGA